MADPPPPAPSSSSSSSASSSAALAVLTDDSLLPHVTSFQRGIPLLIHELVVLHQSTRAVPPYNLMWRSVMARGDLSAVKLLCRMRSDIQYTYLQEIHILHVPRFAMAENRLDVLQWFHETGAEPAPWHQSLMADAVFHQYFTMASWLLENRPDACRADVTKAFERAAEHGNVPFLEELFAYQPGALLPSVLDTACMYGQWDVIQYLHYTARASCTTRAMDKAAELGHMDVGKFLHENRTEGCTTHAMDYAAYQGHLDVIVFLHEHRTEGCTAKAMDYAAGRGHLEIVRFLHENRTEGCTKGAMDMAAGSGHLEIVRFLRENCTEGMYNALAYARDNNHPHVVSYLLGE